MATAKGIQEHPLFKLGKAKAKQDPRNLQFARILQAPASVPIPDVYDFDVSHVGIPTPMFANDVYGCCVISGRAHQTLRFEDIEQKAVVTITDQEVIDEYFKETGGPDSGLVVLNSLRKWRKVGWTAAGQLLKIKAFAQVNPLRHEEVKRAIFTGVGVGFGVSLPKSAKVQIQTGQPWDVVNGPAGEPGSWGGHYIYLPGYTAEGPVCVTWGRKQQLTWAFVDKYCDEAYAIIDDINTSKKKKLLSERAINEFLATI